MRLRLVFATLLSVGVGLLAATSAHAATNPWTAVAAPTTDMGRLWAVSADSATDAWATGCIADCVTDSTAQVLHYTAGKWKVAKTFGGHGPCHGSLEGAGVKAFSPTDVWVAGYANSVSFCTGGLVEHWNGTKWSRSLLDIADETGFTGISGTSDTNLWVTIDYYGGAALVWLATQPVGNS